MKSRDLSITYEHSLRATTNSHHNYPMVENILCQSVMVRRPNQACVADITYIPTDEGWLYLAEAIDPCPRKIVGWSMDRVVAQKLVMDALKQAWGRRSPKPGLIHHSDMGSRYASLSY